MFEITIWPTADVANDDLQRKESFKNSFDCFDNMQFFVTITF